MRAFIPISFILFLTSFSSINNDKSLFQGSEVGEGIIHEPDTLTGNLYVYSNRRDTIVFSNPDLGDIAMGPFSQSKIFGSYQIDGVGSNEIIFFRIHQGVGNDHGGTFDISESLDIEQYEIWNTDTKTLLFEVISYYKFECDNSGLYIENVKGTCTFTNDVQIDSAGNVLITNISEEYDVQYGLSDTLGGLATGTYPRCKQTKPSGTYQFSDGKYSIVD